MVQTVRDLITSRRLISDDMPLRLAMCFDPFLPTGVSPGVTVRSYIPYVNLIYGNVINVLPVLLLVLRW